MKPRRRRLLWPTFILLPCLISGCRDQHADPSTVARVRIVDAVPSPVRLDFAVDGHSVARHVDFESNSGYIALDPGQYGLRVRAEHSASSDQVDGTLGKGESYTALALPTVDGIELAVIREPPDIDPPKDKGTLRFIDASPDSPSLSMALDNVIAVDNLRYRRESKPLPLAPGDYEVKLWTGDDTQPLWGPSTVHLDGGSAYTIVAMGRRSDGSLTTQFYKDN